MQVRVWEGDARIEAKNRENEDGKGDKCICMSVQMLKYVCTYGCITCRVLNLTNLDKLGLRVTKLNSAMKMANETNGAFRSCITGNNGTNGKAARGNCSNT
jgi:hypothetical protein